MKRLLPLLLTVLLLSACGEQSLPAESSLPESSAAENSAAESQAEEVSEEPSSEESAVPESSAESSAEGTALTPVRTLEGDYEAMVPANFRRGVTPRPARVTVEEPLFFAVQQNGLWGLIDEKGVEILPCQGEELVYLCPEGHWSWYSDIRTDPLKWDTLSAKVEQATGYPLCPGHGGSSYQLFATTPGEAPRYFGGVEGGHGIEELKPEDTRGDAFFPTQYTDLFYYEGEAVDIEPGGYWNFADLEGNVLCPNEEFDQVGWFSGETLAPVQKDRKWAYVDAEGKFATGFVYESCWGSNYFYNPDTEEYELEEPCYTYSLWEGFAPVVRDGQWGVLDETGKEILPCQYEAGAPYPGGAFLKKDGVWGLYLLKTDF